MYEVLYLGLLATNRGLEALSELRVHSKILDKFEGIGVAVEQEGVSTFTLRPEGGNLNLEEAEYNLMEDCLTKVRWKAAGSRKAVVAMEWFYAAEEH